MLFLASVLLSACAGGSGPAAVSAASSVPPPGNPSATAAGLVLAAYRGMWSDLVAAARTSDFQSPLLAEHASGTALSLFVRGLARDQLHGVVTRGEPTIQPSVTSLLPSADPTRATVADCVDDAHWVEYTTSGAKAANPAGGPRNATATLADSHGVWKVTGITVGKVGSCRPS